MGVRRTLRRAGRDAILHLRRRVTRGYCTICEKDVFFGKIGPWLRDEYICTKCDSIPRNRALLKVLNDHFPLWRDLQIHESSPGGPSSDKIRRECPNLVTSQFYPDVPRGEIRNGHRSEDLQALTFPNESFDLVISQDVFEHVLCPERAFSEIARTLRPNGAHVFTVPYYRGEKTVTRARATRSGEVEFLMEADYHGNPIDSKGSLVVTEWGDELCQFIFEASGMTTSIFNFYDTKLGLEGEFLDVLVSRKVEPLIR